MKNQPIDQAKWVDLLERAVNEPGIIHEAYSQFHGYSIGNQMLALSQCLARGLQPGPIATYKQWKDLGRQVQSRDKVGGAICLWQPFDGKKTVVNEDTGEEKIEYFKYFKLRPRWFVLSQTEGNEVKFPETPGWELDRALGDLEIKEIPFDHIDGNALGFVPKGTRQLAINPINPLPLKTAIHEVAHILHGHAEEGEIVEVVNTPRNLQEVEAEAVALIVMDALELPGQEYSRGYIQKWWGAGNEIPEDSAQKIFGAANKILQAGREGKQPLSPREI